MPLKLIEPGQRKGNKFYLVRGTLDGKPVEVSTKEKTRRAAQRFLDGLPALLRSLGDIRRETATFGDAIDLYSAWRSPGRNDHRYLAALRRKFGDKLLSGITPAGLIQAANELYPAGEAATKNRNVLVPAAAALHHAAESQLCGWIRVKKFKEPLPEARGIDPALAAIAMAEATGALKLLLTWLFLVGTRISETLGGRLEHLDRKAATIRLKIGKDDEWHVYPLPRAVMKLLPKGEAGWVFPWRTRGGADKHRRKLCKAIGIKFTFHQCRHTFGSSIVNAGSSLDPLPHWRDPKSRARYGRPDIARVREVMALSAPPKPGKIRGRGRKAS
jgi:integrase